MHSNIFPTTRQMEAEVIQMTASLVGGSATSTTAPEICGSMTSGGTESILTAVKASRDHERRRRRITRPEMVIAPSAHAAFVKASEYFNIDIVKAPLDGGHRLTAAAVRRCLSRNTVLVVASAVGYPHGVMDDVEGIAALCKERGVLLHVDCCLGGFVLPFLKFVRPDIGGTMGRADLAFDFRLPGVTSMSLDVHKFGGWYSRTTGARSHTPTLSLTLSLSLSLTLTLSRSRHTRQGAPTREPRWSCIARQRYGGTSTRAFAIGLAVCTFPPALLARGTAR